MSHGTDGEGYLVYLRGGWGHEDRALQVLTPHFTAEDEDMYKGVISDFKWDSDWQLMRMEDGMIIHAMTDRVLSFINIDFGSAGDGTPMFYRPDLVDYESNLVSYYWDLLIV